MTELQKAIANAVINWAALIQFFPQDGPGKRAVMDYLERMVNTAAEMRWLERIMIDKVGIWRGAKELRGVFCSRFAPKDHINADCAEGPFSPEAMEMRAITAGRHSERLCLPAPADMTPEEIEAQKEENRELVLRLSARVKQLEDERKNRKLIGFDPSMRRAPGGVQ